MFFVIPKRLYFNRQLADIPCPNGTDVDITYIVDGLPLVVSGRKGSITATATLDGYPFRHHLRELRRSQEHPHAFQNQIQLEAP